MIDGEQLTAVTPKIVTLVDVSHLPKALFHKTLLLHFPLC